MSNDASFWVRPGGATEKPIQTTTLDPCGTCRFYVPADDKTGQCRCHAPRARVVPVGEPHEVCWPEVAVTEGCGDHCRVR